MAHLSPLVGRERERALLDAGLARCKSGQGGVVLVGGESGIGKSRLVEEALGGWEGAALRTTAVSGGSAYAPFREVLGLGPGSADGLILEALVATARRRATAVLLDDVHAADAATIELLLRADEVLAGEQLVVITTYRTDQLPRRHAVRSLRAQLRRHNRLDEIVLAPLDLEQTHQLVDGIVGQRPAPALVAAIHDRSGGVPFFVEELVGALVEGGGLLGGPEIGLAGEADLPLPESVLDATLARTADLREDHAEAVSCAATLGPQVNLVALAALVGSEEVDALLDAGLLIEFDERTATFRHALIRDALHRAIPWALRRTLHERAAHALVGAGAPPGTVAEHWLAAQAPARARRAWLAAAEQHCSVHAYRDAATATRRALALWPPAEDPAGRLAVLTRLAECAELCGDTAAAGETWTELAAEHRAAGRPADAAAAHRRVANAAELLGQSERALSERTQAAEAFETAGLLGSAAEDRLSVGQKLKAAGRLSEALQELVAAGGAAESVGDEGVAAVAMTLEGATRAALGEGGRGVQLARAGLARALAGQLVEAAAEATYELGAALEYAADYAASVEAYESATDLCREHDLAELGEVCFVCTSPVSRLMGDWDRVIEICAAVLANDESAAFTRRVADEESGLVCVLRGDSRRAKAPLRRAAEFGRVHGIFGLEVGAVWGLAMVAALDEDHARAENVVTSLVARCARSDEGHYALPALRWSASYLASRGAAPALAEVHRLLANHAVRNASPKVLSTLAHATAELALVEGRGDRGEAMMSRSLALLAEVTAPYEKALSTLRWGELAAATGRREEAVARLTTAYRTARLLGARPLADRSASALAAMGESVDQRLGRLAARGVEYGGLTRREREVLAHLALDETNREIAAALFLSTRTVDMHVRHVLEKLGCSSRSAAVRRAVERGWLTVPA